MFIFESGSKLEIFKIYLGYSQRNIPTPEESSAQKERQIVFLQGRKDIRDLPSVSEKRDYLEVTAVLTMSKVK